MEHCRACGNTADLVPSQQIPGGFLLLDCPRCLSATAVPEVADQDLGHLYDGLFSGSVYRAHVDEHERAVEGSVRTSRYRVRQLRALEAKLSGRRMIEIGGGTGVFGLVAARRGWSYTDFDVSPVAAEHVRSLGLAAEVFDPDSPPPLDEGSADVVVMWEVIEHVWPLAETLRQIRSSLLPGGFLLLSTPNFARPAYRDKMLRGVGSAPPIHVTFFTQRSLETTLGLAGFRSVEVWGRRFHRPDPTLRSVARCLRMALHLEEPQTLIAVAQA